nr:MAG TPA: hypothetical protein [Caudoviricetes sp.]
MCLEILWGTFRFKHIPLPCHKPFYTYLWIGGEKFCNYIFGYPCFTLQSTTRYPYFCIKISLADTQSTSKGQNSLFYWRIILFFCLHDGEMFCIFASCSMKNERPKIMKKAEINEF